MVKEIYPFSINNIYRKYFEEVYDFTDANNYGLSIGSSGIVFNSLKSISGNPTRDLSIPNRTIDDIKKDGLDVTTYLMTFNLPTGISKYTLCIVFYFWRNRDFSIRKKDPNGRSILLNLFYSSRVNIVFLNVNRLRSRFTLPSSFNGKKNCYMVDKILTQILQKLK